MHCFRKWLLIYNHWMVDEKCCTSYTEPLLRFWQLILVIYFTLRVGDPRIHSIRSNVSIHFYRTLRDPCRKRLHIQTEAQHETGLFAILLHRMHCLLRLQHQHAPSTLY